MLSELRPLLEETDRHIERRHERMTEELRETYGRKILARESCDRLLLGYAEYLQPLRELLLRSWAVLNQGAKAAFIIELLSKKEQGIEPIALYPVIPTPSGFCTFSEYPGVTPSAYPDEVNLKNFYERVARLPAFLQQFLRHYERIYVNTASVYYGVPDIVVLYAVPYSANSLKNFVQGTRRRAISKKFGDLEDLRVLASCKRTPMDWTIFFDDSAKGDQTLYVALDAKFADIRKLVNPQEAYDLMFEHYLLGTPGEFDFRPFTEELIWK